MTSIKIKVERFVEDYRTLKLYKGYIPYSGSSRGGSHIRNLTEMFSHLELSNREIELWAINEAGGICYWCLKEVFILKEDALILADDDKPEARDHVLPASKGYLYTLGNVGLMHAKCNGEKSDMSLESSFEYLRKVKGFTEEQIELSNQIIEKLQKPIKDDEGYSKFFNKIEEANDKDSSENNLLKELYEIYYLAEKEGIVKIPFKAPSPRESLSLKLEGTVFDSVLDGMDFDKKHSLGFVNIVFEEAISRKIDLTLASYKDKSSFVNICKDEYKKIYLETTYKSSKRIRARSAIFSLLNRIDSKCGTKFEENVELYKDTKTLDISSDNAPQEYRDMSYLIEVNTSSDSSKETDRGAFRSIVSKLEAQGIYIDNEPNKALVLSKIKEIVRKESKKLSNGSAQRLIIVGELLSICTLHPNFIDFIKDLSEIKAYKDLIPRIINSILKDYRINPNSDFTKFFELNPYKEMYIDASSRVDSNDRFGKFIESFLKGNISKIKNDYSDSSIISNSKLITKYARKRAKGVKSASEKSRFNKFGKDISSHFNPQTFASIEIIGSEKVYTTDSLLKTSLVKLA